MYKDYDLVLFDLDGTLVDSVPLLTAGINAVMANLRMRPFTVEEIAPMIGKGVRVLLERVCDARGIFATDQTLSTMQKTYEQCVKDLDADTAPFYPHALEGIRRLRKMGIYTGLVTNKSRVMTEDFIAKRGIADLFDLVVTGDDTPHPKPAGDMIRLALKKVHCTHDRALMIGDSRNDALAARACTVDALLVKTGYNEGEPIEQWAKKNNFPNVCKDVFEAVCWVMARTPEFKLKMAK